MELSDVMRTQNACRYFKPDPVPDEAFYNAIELARFGPQGGNRQPVRFLIVRDPAKKEQLAAWYRTPWSKYYNAMKEGEKAIRAEDEDETEKATFGRFTKLEKALEDANNFANSFGEHPAIVVVCADLSATHPTDTELDRLSIVGGASVYPVAQNFCLAMRDQDIATAFTTLLVAYEPQVKELLDIPEKYSTAAHIVVGYPAKPFPKKLSRLPVEELAHVDTFGTPLKVEG